MKRLFLSIILCACTLPSFSQNPKVMDLSYGGCHIDSIRVEKIGNDFIMIPELDSVAIGQVVINAGVKKELKVRQATPNDLLFTEETTNHTDIRYKDKPNKILLPIFTLQVGNDYIVEHNNKLWNIKVRKDNSFDALTNVTNGRAIFLNAQNMLCIGDSVVSMVGCDTLHYVLTDSLIVSDIDRRLTLKCDGKKIKDTLVSATDDMFFYSTKRIVSSDSVFYAGDRLAIEKNGKHLGIIFFEAEDNSKDRTKQIILIVFAIVFVTVSIFVCQWFIRNRKKQSQKNDIKDGNADDKGDEGKNDDATNTFQMQVAEFYNELNELIESLLRIMPKRVNGVSKNNFFLKRDNLEDIINNIKLVKASNRRDLIKKCTYILEFIETHSHRLAENQFKLADTTDTTGNTKIPKNVCEVKAESTNECNESFEMRSDEKSTENLTECQVESSEESSTDEALDISGIQRFDGAESTMETEQFEMAKKYDTLQTKYNNLAEDYKKEKENYTKEIEDVKAETRRQVEIEMQTKVESAQRQAEEAEKKRKALEESQQTAIEEAVKKEKELQEKEMERLKGDKRKADERAEIAERSKKKAVEEAVKKEKEAYDKEEKRLKDLVEKHMAELTSTKGSLESTLKELNDTKDERDKKNIKIEQLEKAQEEFTLSLTSVPFATAYSKQVLDLLDLGRLIRTSAHAVLDIAVDDPYFIMKAVSRFGKMMDDIDVDKFLIDVNMVAKAKFIFKDSSLATFNGENKDIDNIVRSYFFNQYLEKYVNALMVLNESMIGLKLLLPELNSQVDKFEKFRTELLAIAKKLNIIVLYVKVGDMAGENVDLKAKPVDVEIGEPGQILEVENCIVYLTDSRKPQTKIKVTIKK